MPESLAWSLSAGAVGGSIGDSGKLDVEATTAASVTVDAAVDTNTPTARELTFQLADVANIALLVVKASNYSGQVTLQAAGQDAPEVDMTGPLVLFGDGVTLFGDSLATLTITNADDTAAVDVEILLGRKLS